MALCFTAILEHIFKQTNNWVLVPEHLTSLQKRLDIVSGRIRHAPKAIPKQMFSPKIAIELKGAKANFCF